MFGEGGESKDYYMPSGHRKPRGARTKRNKAVRRLHQMAKAHEWKDDNDGMAESDDTVLVIRLISSNFTQKVSDLLK